MFDYFSAVVLSPFSLNYKFTSEIIFIDKYLIYTNLCLFKNGDMGEEFYFVLPVGPLRLSFLPSFCRHKTQSKRGLEFFASTKNVFDRSIPTRK